ncbi:cGMP-dependent protein kinase 1 isoform X1 [Ictalurus punctatus]|uniref:cGMP-dependent protein kinase n=2 Tax=Ictalurus punctatus TaxID=7998 RepID=A0A2D0QH84_ICTPU|nr:cGMP-dependent protein kinase 1 isoform X1 [Ictalurus punctatus]
MISSCLRTSMEVTLKELRQKLEKQCQLNRELQNEKEDLETRLKEKEKLVEELQSRLDGLDQLSQRYSNDRVEVRQSRAAVMAPEPIPDDMDISTTRVKKTASERAQIMKAMQKNDFLSRLDEEQINMMVELLTTLDRCPGDEIIKEGTEGDSLYIVAAGELRVTQAGRILRTLTSGDVFGELAILYNCKRTATVKAVTAVKLWCIERQIYRSIMAIKSKKKREQLMGFLKTARTFKSLRDGQLSSIIDSMEEVKFQENEVIVREGAEGDTFYIILKGEVEVTKKVNGQQKIIRKMKQGDHFGELALIRENLRTATCTALGSVTCFAIDKEAFEETIPIEILELHDDPDLLENTQTSKKQSLVSSLQLSDLIPVLYQEGRYQGSPVTLGLGGFGRVELVTTLYHGKYFALKKISKKLIVEKRQEEHVLFEKKLLLDIECDFIVRLHDTFKDSRYIYMVMEFCSGGEIWTKLKEVRRFEENITVFVAACVVEAYSYLHKKDIMYRDLKPENLMLDSRGYIKLVDFGFAKKLQRGQKTYSFCGTPEYMAPEIIQNQGHDFGADFWSLGVLVYELLVGSPPFSSSEPQSIYAKILDGVIKYPPYMGEAARSLISKLCRPRPGQRLGNTKNGIKDVRNHRWFNNMNWHKLRMKQISAPTVKLIRKGPCYINFDRFPFDKSLAEEDLSGWDRDF